MSKLRDLVKLVGLYSSGPVSVINPHAAKWRSSLALSLSAYYLMASNFFLTQKKSVNADLGGKLLDALRPVSIASNLFPQATVHAPANCPCSTSLSIDLKLASFHGQYFMVLAKMVKKEAGRAKKRRFDARRVRC